MVNSIDFAQSKPDNQTYPLIHSSKTAYSQDADNSDNSDNSRDFQKT